MTDKKILGTIVSIRGQVVEVRFEGDKPAIHEVLTVVGSDTDALVVQSSAETNDTLYCLALSPIQGLHRGLSVIATNSTVMFPVGERILGRVLNVFGEPVDNQGALTEGEERAVYRYSLPAKVIAPHELMETGIKLVDFFTPLMKGGKTGLFGGAGVGKTMLLTEILHNVVGTASGNNQIPNTKLQTKSNNQNLNQQSTPMGGQAVNGEQQTVLPQVQGKRAVSVFAGVGERSREGLELYHALLNSGVFDSSSLIFGQMGENPAIRFLSAFAGVTMAEYFRDVLQRDVLFFIDNIFRFAQAGNELSTLMATIPSQDGYQPTLESEVADFHERLVSTESGAITTIEAIYVPADDLLDHAVQSVFAYLDSSIVLSREVYQQGFLPAVDILASNSAWLSPQYVGEAHYQAALAARSLLEESQRLERVASLMGETELSSADQLLLHRARKLRNYMTQNFFVAESQSDSRGVFIPLVEVVKDVQAVLAGKHDAVPDEKFVRIGTVKEVTE